jgi:hypothetical protein
MSQPDDAAKKRPKSGRSPSYPGINLALAIERARVIWDHEKRNAAPVRVIMLHWGYKNPSGGLAGVTFGALKKFGLVEDEGSGLDRPAKLTDLAFEIINNPDPREAIKRAALRPPIHLEMWDQYGIDLPSAEALKWNLLQRGFTESGATEFIREYRETVAFARLSEGTAEGATDDDSDEEEGQHDEADGQDGASGKSGNRMRKRVGMSRESGETQTVAVPMIGAPAVMIEGKFPLTERDWTYFMTVLNAMKPGLVDDRSPSPNDTASE